MALKKTVTAEEHKKLPSDIQKEYVKDGDNFKLDVEGGIDSGLDEMKRAKDNEVKETKRVKALLAEKETELENLQKEFTEKLKTGVSAADVARIEKQYQDKITKIENDYKGQLGGMTTQLQTMLVDNVATAMAAKISNAPSVILPHITKRLKAEFKDGKAVTKVLAADGTDSILTVEELEKEIIANKDFSAILIANRGSGGGANGSGNGGAGAGKGNTGKIDMTGKASDVAARLKAAGRVQIAAD